MAMRQEELEPLIESHQEKDGTVVIHIARERFLVTLEYFWIGLFALFTASITFWIPTLYFELPSFLFIYSTNTHTSYPLINLTSPCLNAMGSAILAYIRHTEHATQLSTQSHHICLGIRAGLCAVVSTFSLIIEDSERLLHDAPSFHPTYSPQSWFLFSSIFNLLLHPFAWWISPFNLLLNISASMLAFHYVDRYMKNHHEYHMNSQFASFHTWTFIWILSCVSFISWIGAYYLDYNAYWSAVDDEDDTNVTTHVNNTSHSLWMWTFDLTFSMIWAILGAFTSQLYGNKHIHRHDVQWPTFRVNFTSCILIATTYNILKYQGFMKHVHIALIICLRRFITSFCGSLSSFAALIEETMVIMTSKHQKSIQIAFQNLLFNLFLCLCAFFFVVHAVTILVSLMWSFPL